MTPAPDAPEFRPVPGHESVFEVSADGDVRSARTGRLLRHHIGRTGYPIIATRVGGRKGRAVCMKVHRMVALAWVPGRTPERAIVHHKNAVKTDARAANLEWVTAGENVARAYADGSRPILRGERNHSARLTERDVIALRDRFARRPSIPGLRAIAASYGVDHSSLYQAIRGRTWRHLPMPQRSEVPA